MENGLLRKVEHLRNIQRHLCRALHAGLDFLARRLATRRAKNNGRYLEFVHDRHDLVLECFVGNLSTSKINFVTNENDRDIDSKLAEVRKPIRRYPVEGGGIFDRVDNAYNVGFADFGFQVLLVVGVAYKDIRRMVKGWRVARRTARVHDVRCYIFRCNFRRDGNFWDDVLNLGGPMRQLSRAHVGQSRPGTRKIL